jgi:hypothetical protein
MIDKWHNNTVCVFEHCNFLNMATGCIQNMEEFFYKSDIGADSWH